MKSCKTFKPGYRADFLKPKMDGIGPKIPGNSPNRLTSKLNHFFHLKMNKGVSLNHQLAAHPDFHAPGITEGLLNVIGLDPWASNLPNDVSNPFWEVSDYFDYAKVAQEQRIKWEAKNQQIMNATSSTKTEPSNTNTKNIPKNNLPSMPRKRI